MIDFISRVLPFQNYFLIVGNKIVEFLFNQLEAKDPDPRKILIEESKEEEEITDDNNHDDEKEALKMYFLVEIFEIFFNFTKQIITF